mgnify:CR=1 FL=1|jgi:hypothetical protein
MKLESQRQQLVRRLPPKQQTLDFANSQLWQRLRKDDQLACRDAVAKLLCQVLLATQEHDEHE